MVEKTLQGVLNDVCNTEPKVILSAREVGKKTFQKTEGTIYDNNILRWMGCLVLAYKMDFRENTLQVAVEGEPYDWGKTD